MHFRFNVPEGFKNIEEVESQIRTVLKNEKAKSAAFVEAIKSSLTFHLEKNNYLI